MEQFLNVTLSGVTQGAIYAAFALALVLIWRSTRIINFAQGAMAMFTTYLALAVIQAGMPYWVGFGAALLGGLVLGALVERIVIRPVGSGPELNAVIVTLGLFIAIQALAAIVFGATYQSFPAPFGLRGMTIGGLDIGLNPFGLFIVGSAVGVMLLLVGLFRFTSLGLRMRAAAFNQEMSRLLGIKVGHMLTLGWALAAMVGALSGMLTAGGDLVFPAYMNGMIVYGFVAAVLGGLDSPVGAVVGGLIMGLALSFVAGYVGAELVTLTALGLLVVTLLLRPHGLFSSAKARRV